MERVTVDYARAHLDELIERAARGEDVQIADPRVGTLQLSVIERATRRGKRCLGNLEGLQTVPARLMEPMSEEELRDWYGDDL